MTTVICSRTNTVDFFSLSGDDNRYPFSQRYPVDISLFRGRFQVALDCQQRTDGSSSPPVIRRFQERLTLLYFLNKSESCSAVTFIVHLPVNFITPPTAAPIVLF